MGPFHIGRSLRAALFMSCGVVLWVLLEVTASGLRELSSLQIVWMRYAIHLVALFAIAGPRGFRPMVRTGRPAFQIGRGLLMLFMPISFLLAMQVMSHADVRAVFALAPLLVLLLARACLREKVSLIVWGMAAIAFIGVELIAAPSRHLLALPSVFAVSMAACLAVYLAMTRSLSRTDTIRTNLFWSAAAVFVPLSVGLPLFWSTPALHDVPRILAVGGLGLATLFCLEKAIETVPVSRLAPLVYAQPLWLILVHAAAGQGISAEELAGCVIVVLALSVFLARVTNRNRESSASARHGSRTWVPGSR